MVYPFWAFSPKSGKMVPRMDFGLTRQTQCHCQSSTGPRLRLGTQKSMVMAMFKRKFARTIPDNLRAPHIKMWGFEAKRARKFTRTSPRTLPLFFHYHAFFFPDKGTNLRGQTPIVSFLRVPALFYTVSCENLRLF